MKQGVDQRGTLKWFHGLRSDQKVGIVARNDLFESAKGGFNHVYFKRLQPLFHCQKRSSG